MRKLILAAGVAAMAISAPAASKPDRDGNRHSQVQKKRGGQAQAHRGGSRQAQRVERRGGGERRAQRAERRGGSEARSFRMSRGGGERRAQRFERRGGNERRAQRIERRGGDRRVVNVNRDRNERRAQRIERRGNERRFANFRSDRNERRAQRMERRNREARAENRRFREVRQNQRERQFRAENRSRERMRDIRLENRDRRLAFDDRRDRGDRIRIVNRGFGDRADFRGKWRDREFRVADRVFAERVLGPRYFDTRNYSRVRNTVYYVNSGLPAAYYGGCPAGLTWDSWSCVPPYYAETQFIGQVLPTMYASNYFPQSLRYIYADTPNYYYRYGDGYVYRVNRGDNLISALLPLIGAGLGVGMPFPYQGSNYYVPSYYQSFYPSYEGDYYRYANGYVYEIDGPTGYVENVIPLLDRGYGVGQMLPTSYSYYNVPYQYRSLYYDNDDYYYRYAPGAIYQVDRDSQLITSVASLLTGGLAVGQPLPPAYSVYNVPYQYRTTYYDSPDAWYRYSDGYIYQVDPTTQLITAIVRSIV